MTFGGTSAPKEGSKLAYAGHRHCGVELGWMPHCYIVAATLEDTVDLTVCLCFGVVSLWKIQKFEERKYFVLFMDQGHFSCCCFYIKR